MVKKSNLTKETREPGNKPSFPMPVSSYKMILIGFGVVILGFVLMAGGGSENPDVFNYDIFSFRRITLAPIVVLLGFAFIFWAIMRKPKESEEE
ncbi:DUF3098 domain-containing protein [Porphyromonadaceae bacterium OttesenSCG-928-L07]|nr:DUF3098 domain-containing protein [Porphyromonadaceae bacterium OttesenSCG-928-L07]MDL2331098.1 DUF3098 domain-containing protein [Odoribacter sp. OttesenSCG-928-A06]